MKTKSACRSWLYARVIDVLAIMSLVIVIGRTLLLAIEEPVPWMSETGELAYDLSLALLTGWLLNWLLVERPRRSAQTAMYEVVGPRIQSLGGVGRSIAQTFAQHLGLPLSAPDTGPTEAEWQRICDVLYFETSLSNVMRPAGGAFASESVLGFLLSEFKRADEFVTQVQRAAVYFDVELNALVHREQTDPLRRIVTRNGGILSGPLRDTASMFIGYDQACRRISNYYEEHVRPRTSNRTPGS